MKTRVTVVGAFLSVIPFSLYSMDANQGNPLCKLPSHLLAQIAHSPKPGTYGQQQILTWSDILAIQTTCRRLHDNFTDKAKKIHVGNAKSHNVGNNETVEAFLNRIIVKLCKCDVYPHKNPIVLNLGANHLSEDRDGHALEQFFKDLDTLGLADRIVELDLTNNNLSELPDSINKLKNLSTLNLEFNSLSIEALSKICSMQSLRKLDLSHNNLGALPNEISSMLLQDLNIGSNHLSPNQVAKIGYIKTLVCLSLVDNQLQSLPGSIAELDNLEILNLRNTDIPASELEKVGKFKKIRILELSNNALANIPEKMCISPTLRVLFLSHNRLSDADLIKLCNLTALQELSLDFNEIHTIPAEIGKLNDLHLLDLSQNIISEQGMENMRLLSNVEGLGMNHCGLHTLPPQIHELQRLKVLEIKENNFDEETLCVIFSLLPTTCDIIAAEPEIA